MKNVDESVIGSQQTMTPRLPSVRVLFKLTTAYYKEHFHVIASVMLVPMILRLPSIFIHDAIVGIVSSLASFAAVFLANIVLMGLIVGGWDSKASIGVLYKKSFGWIWPLIYVQAYILLCTIGGLFLLIIPGIYASIVLIFSTYCLLSENSRGLLALHKSWYLVKGRWGAVFGRILALWLLFMIVGFFFGALSVGPQLLTMLKEVARNPDIAPKIAFSPFIDLFNMFVQSFVVLPVSVIYMSFMYRALKTIKATDVVVEGDTKKIEKTINIFMLIGFIGIIGTILMSGLFILKMLTNMGGDNYVPVFNHASISTSIQSFLANLWK